MSFGDQFKRELRVIAEEISRSKRFGFDFVVLVIELSHSVPSGLSKTLPGDVISYHILKKNMRAYDIVLDSIARRYHVILPQTGKDEIVNIKERIYKLAQMNNWGEVSIGAAFYPEDGKKPQLLLKRALDF